MEHDFIKNSCVEHNIFVKCRNFTRMDELCKILTCGTCFDFNIRRHTMCGTMQNLRKKVNYAEKSFF